MRALALPIMALIFLACVFLAFVSASPQIFAPTDWRPARYALTIEADGNRYVIDSGMTLDDCNAAARNGAKCERE